MTTPQPPTHRMLLGFALLLLAPWIRAAEAGGPAPEPQTALPVPREGWRLELVAAAPVIRHPSVVCTAPDGRVFVAEDPMDISSERADATEGRILCLHPGGRATVFVDHLHAVFGMKYLEGALHVLHNPVFSVFGDGGDAATNRIDLIESTNPNPWAEGWNDHIPANFSLGMDGYWYIAVGDKGLYNARGRDGRRVDMHGGGVVRMRPDGTGLEVFSTGMRNILDVGISPEDDLFTYDNTDEKQWMSRLTHMVEGGYYGYPYDFHPRQPWILWCVADYGPGAATGVFLDTEGRLPARYRGCLFLGDFGKHQVFTVRLERRGGTFLAVDAEDLFPDPPADFRPVGICPSWDGTSLYICDWQHRDTKEKVTVGRLFRLTPTVPEEPQPERPAWLADTAMGRPTRASTDDLIGALEHPSRTVRMNAQRALAARGGPEVLDGLSAVVQNPRVSPEARWHAIWALDAIDHGESAREAIRAAAHALEPSVRRQAVRQLGLRRVPDAVPELVGRLEDEDASVRMLAATALGRVGDPDGIRPLEDALLRGEADEFARFAMVTALTRLGTATPSAWPGIVAAMISRTPEGHALAPLVFRETYDPALVAALSAFASNPETSLTRRKLAVTVLGGLYRKVPPWKGEWWVYHPVNQPPPSKSVDWEGTPTVTATVAALLEGTAPELQSAALEVAAGAGIEGVIPQIRARWEKERDPDRKVPWMSALARLHDAGSAPGLASSLTNRESPEALLRAAIEAASTLGSPSNTTTRILSSAVAGRLDQEGGLPPALQRQAVETLGRLGDPSVTNTLAAHLRSPDTALALAALKAYAAVGGASDKVGGVLDDPRVEVKRGAIEALTTLRAREMVPPLVEYAKLPELRESAMRALGTMPDIRALDVYLAHVAGNQFALRDQAHRALAAVADEALPRLESRAGEFSPEVLAALQSLYEGNPKARSGPLFAQRAKVKTPEDYLAAAMAGGGVPLNGQRLFLNTSGVGCVRCHRALGNGGDVGPDLGNIGAQFDRKTLAESVLWPSRVVREGYQQTLLELRNGETLSGLVKAESSESITLRDVDGRNRTVPKADIAERTMSALSLMPEGLHALLSLEEFRDLVAFLESLRTPTGDGLVPVPRGFVPLFTGTNLSGWRVEGTGASRWRAADGILERDGGAGDLYAGAEVANFRLQLDWRWLDPPVPVEYPAAGAEGGTGGKIPGLDAGEAGLLLRGHSNAVVRFSCEPPGSGDLAGYRTNSAFPAELRKSVLLRRQADRPVGLWNHIALSLQGDRLTLQLNGEELLKDIVLPGMPVRGPLALLGGKGRVAFRNVFLEPLDTEAPPPAPARTP